jgi:large subunit ribosomal protein L21
MTFAVIKTGGKQYKVAQGDVFEVEKLETKDGKVTIEDVLLVVDGDKVTVGAPLVIGASVAAKVLVEEGKGEKKMVFRYHNKTRYRKKKGHRQPFTKIEITKITA